MMKAARRLAAFSAVLILAGCASTKDASPWEDWVELPPAPIGWRGIATTEPADEPLTRVKLTGARTAGLFPGSLAVARVTAFPGEGLSNTVHVALAEQPPNEFVGWMELFDDFWQVSEVFPLAYPGLRIHGGVPGDFLARAADIGADLCLIYAIDLRRPQTDIRGALYRVDDGAMLATIHEQAVYEYLDGEEPPAPPDRVEEDKRHVDPLFIALNRFREQVRSTMCDLIEKDQPGGSPRPRQVRTAADQPANRPVSLTLP